MQTSNFETQLFRTRDNKLFLTCKIRVGHNEWLDLQPHTFLYARNLKKYLKYLYEKYEVKN